MPRVAGRQIHRCNATADNPEQYYQFHSFVAFILHSQRKLSSSRKSQEENTSPSDEALEEVNNHIKEAFEILKGHLFSMTLRADDEERFGISRRSY